MQNENIEESNNIEEENIDELNTEIGNEKDNKKSNKTIKRLIIILLVIIVNIGIYAAYSKYKGYAYEGLTGVARNEIAYEIIYYGNNATQGVVVENLEAYGYSSTKKFHIGKPKNAENNATEPIHQRFYDVEGTLLFEDICFGNYSCIAKNGKVILFYH